MCVCVFVTGVRHACVLEKNACLCTRTIATYVQAASDRLSQLHMALIVATQNSLPLM